MTPRYDARSQPNADSEGVGSWEQWLPRLYNTSGADIPTVASHLPSAFHSVSLPPTLGAGSFRSTRSDTNAMASNSMRGYTGTGPSLLDHCLEATTQVNLRIHHAARSLPSPTHIALSSPALHSIFDAACTLVNLVDSYASGQFSPHQQTQRDYQGILAQEHISSPLAPSHNPTDSDVPPAIRDALDSSIRLTVHASHQALMGVFDELSRSFLLHLAGQPHQHSPSPFPPTAASLQPSIPQMAATTTLMSHLFQQLDRGIRSISQTQRSPQSQGHGVLSPSYPQVMTPNDTGESQGGFTSLDQQFGEQAGQQHSWQENGAWTLLHEMGQTQRRVGDQIKAVERLLEQANVHVL